MLKFALKIAAALVLALSLPGCLSLAIGDNSSRRARAECTHCGKDLHDQLCEECQQAKWNSACAECAKLGQGHMCAACQEKAGK